jgi:hypothetical protein
VFLTFEDPFNSPPQRSFVVMRQCTRLKTERHL